MIDFTALAPRKIDFPKIDFTNLDLSKFDVRKFEFPNVDLPTFEASNVDVSAEVDKVADFVRDAAYAGIGMWIIAAQKVDAEVRKLAGKAA